MNLLPLSLLILFTSVGADRGYIITAPNLFIPGRPESVCIDLVDVGADMTIQFTLLLSNSWSASDVSSVTTKSLVDVAVAQINANETTRCVKLKISERVFSEANYKNFILSVQGFETANQFDGWTFKDEIGLDNTFYSSSKVILIQTDKPIYKPGQIVRIRTMTLDTLLKPLNLPINYIEIVNPDQIIVERWTNITTVKSFSSFTFELSDAAKHGVWTIRLQPKYDRISQKSFTVEQYVLPTFEVTITPQKFITLRNESLAADICARYTFDKPVNGLLAVMACLGSDPVFCQTLNPTEIMGCTKVNFSRHEVGWDYRYNSWQTAKIKITAKVTENGTGTERESSASVSFSQYVMKLDIDGGDSFKPGLPYYAKVKVVDYDDKPMKGIQVNVTINEYGKYRGFNQKYMTDDNGTILVTLPPVTDDRTSLIFYAELIAEGKVAISKSKSIYAHFSMSGSYIQILPTPAELKCGSTLSAQIMYTTSSEINTVLFVKVAGVGDFALATSLSLQLKREKPTNFTDRKDTANITAPQESSFEYKPSHMIATHTGALVVNLSLTQMMSPKSHLVVYYVRPDGEVVSDSIDMDVTECVENSVSMIFSKNETFPGSPSKIEIKTQPNSTCSYNVVDKSVLIQGGDNLLTLPLIRQSLYSYILSHRSFYPDIPNTDDFCSMRYPDAPDYNGYTSYWSIDHSSVQDSYYKFEKSGMRIKSNLKLVNKPCVKYFNRMSSFMGRDSAASSVGRDSAASSRGRDGAASSMGRDGAPGAAGAPGPMGPPSPSGEPERVSPGTPALELRSFFPETWLFDIVEVGHLGSVNLDVTVPHTVTKWIGNAVCVNNKTSVGVSQQASLNAFQPFFVSLSLPYSVIRGESLPLAVTVSNYVDTCLPVTLSVLTSLNYNIEGTSSTNLCVCKSDVASATFYIRPLVVDKEMKISVNATTTQSGGVCAGKITSPQRFSDTIIKTLRVEAEGMAKEKSASEFFCIPNGTNFISRDYQVPVPPQTSDLIADSIKVYTTVVGDPMGPVFDNLQSLLQTSAGDCESATTTFINNAFVLKYLDARGLSSPAIKEQARRFLKDGYQRILAQVNPNGMYTSYVLPSYYTVNVWLTAFVIKGFAQAKQYIFIDTNLQSRSVNNLLTFQDVDGCFSPEQGQYKREWQQGFSRWENRYSLTAYIVISLIESGFKENSKVQLEKAVKCLVTLGDDSPFQTALVSYAFALYNKTDDRAVRAFERLQSLSTTDTDGNIYWSTGIETKWFGYSYNSANVETTGYALMSLLIMGNSTDKTEKGLSVIKWLNKQRAYGGGFWSTQDTVVGIQAISMFSSMFFNGNISLNISLRGKLSGIEHRFNLTRSNAIVPYTRKLDRHENVAIQANGVGCFLLQTSVKYNIRISEIARAGLFPYQTNVSIIDREDADKRNCSRKLLEICSRYNNDTESGQVVIEVGLQSGWSADTAMLEDLIKQQSSTLRKVEKMGTRSIHLYFERLTHDSTCVSFHIQRQFTIKNSQPALVKTYSFYNPDEKYEMSYSTKC